MTDNLRGILAVLAASTAFVLNDAVVKLIQAELPSGELIILRGLLATAMLALGVAWMGAMRPIGILFRPLMLVRILAAAGATTCVVLALRHLPLATVNTVLQATPLVVTAGAAMVYRERVGLSRWLAALTGFAGVLLIVKPGAGDFGTAAYILLAALAFTTTRDLATRGLHQAIPSIFVAAASTVAVMLSGFLVLPYDDGWVIASAWAWGMMAISAACLFVANTAMIVALRTGEIAVVAPFRYMPVPLSLGLGYWWWGDVPDAIAFVGIALVVGAGLYTLQRERRGRTAARVPAAEGRSAAE
jgi:drug/metabolite transporter (DMT)-like permease